MSTPAITRIMLTLALMSLSPAAVLELLGLLDGNHQNGRALIIDKSANMKSGGLKAGDLWHGYKVTSIDMKEEKAVLKKGAEELTLQLRSAHVREGVSTSAPLFKVVQGSKFQDGEQVCYSSDSVLQFGQFKISARSGRIESDATSIKGYLSIAAAPGVAVPAAQFIVRDGKTTIRAVKEEKDGDSAKQEQATPRNPPKP